MTKLLRVLRKRFRQLTFPFRYPKQAHALAQSNHALIECLVAEMAEHRREMRTLIAAASLPNQDLWRGLPRPVTGAEPGVDVLPTSTCCREEHFRQPWFSYWNDQFRTKLLYHRKLWEYVYVCQALWERGAIRPGARGLGFGVGGEPLPSWFASRDCRVLGTDMSPEGAAEMGWTSTVQHASGKQSLRWPGICSDEQFEANVAFRECDMNHIPDDLTDFDFCWSACAFEHLGSIEQGLAFVERSVACLKPGGWAVHTTELNLSSDHDTIDNQGTVLFRRRDFKELASRLTAQGHNVAPLDFNAGTGPVDNYIDVPPFRDEPTLKLMLAGYSVTSFGIIVQRGA